MLNLARKQTGPSVAAARRATSLAQKHARSMSSTMEDYGSMCFVGAVADKVRVAGLRKEASFGGFVRSTLSTLNLNPKPCFCAAAGFDAILPQFCKLALCVTRVPLL